MKKLQVEFDEKSRDLLLAVIDKFIYQYGYAHVGREVAEVTKLLHDAKSVEDEDSKES